MKTTTTNLLLGIALGLSSQASTQLWAQAEGKPATPVGEKRESDSTKPAAGIELGGRELSDDELREIRGEAGELDALLKYRAALIDNAFKAGPPSPPKNAKEAAGGGLLGLALYAATWKYGNWGGLGWSGGVDVKKNGGQAGKAAVVDNLDLAFFYHDNAYEKASKEKNLATKKLQILAADNKLAQDMAGIVEGIYSNKIEGLASSKKLLAAVKEASLAFGLKIEYDKVAALTVIKATTSASPTLAVFKKVGGKLTATVIKAAVPVRR